MTTFVVLYILAGIVAFLKTVEEVETEWWLYLPCCLIFGPLILLVAICD